MSQNEEKDWIPAENAPKSGEFKRDTNYIADRIVNKVQEPEEQENGTIWWPVEPQRYRLVGARACPWAHRAIITRRLKGLEDVISLGLAGPTHDKRSWTFDLDPDEKDPVLGIHRLQEAYFARFPDYPRGITVPTIVDVPSGKVVSNDFRQIVKDFNNEWAEHTPADAPDLYPEELREQIDEWGEFLFRKVNNGVYRCGFAGDQESYDKAYQELWEALDTVEAHLQQHRYLVGEHITLADIYLYPTLVRFDVVYHGHFKCNRNKISEMPALWGYLRDLYQTPGFGDTTDFEQIKQHYYIVHQEINPRGIVPLGPDMSKILSAHNRAELGGSPFAPGVRTPGPVPQGEEVLNPLGA